MQSAGSLMNPSVAVTAEQNERLQARAVAAVVGAVAMAIRALLANSTRRLVKHAARKLRFRSNLLKVDRCIAATAIEAAVAKSANCKRTLKTLAFIREGLLVR